jgi:hypothetical protein
VYTLSQKIAVGGHFYMDDSMHLSYWSRLALQKACGLGTNAYNESVVRYFSRMVMAIALKGNPGTLVAIISFND